MFADQAHRVDLERLDGAMVPTVIATVDLDRDGAIDERWILGEGSVRQVSSADDGSYDQTYDLTGEGWLLRGSVDWGAVAERARIDTNVSFWWGRRLAPGTEGIDVGGGPPAVPRPTCSRAKEPPASIGSTSISIGTITSTRCSARWGAGSSAR